VNLPSQLSAYALLERLGTGGMGTVWRARDTRDDGVVAVKVLHAHLAAGAEYVRRFEREARIAASLDSPHIVRVLDSGSDGDSRFLVMEYIEGKTLAQHIHDRGRLDVAETVAVSTAIASALDAAHKAGIVHRDISPQNVLIQPDGSVKVTDFGVARDLGATAMTATSMLLGKPQYIAPEVVTGKSPVDIRSDIYSLGVVMYQMLTGAVPFNAETPYAVMQAQVHQTPPQVRRQRNDLPPSLLTVVEKCLAKDPRERFQTPTALTQALEGDVSGAPAIVSPRRRAAILAVVGLFGLATFGTVLAMSTLNEGTTPAGAEHAVIEETLQPSANETIEPMRDPTQVQTAPAEDAPVEVPIVLEDRFGCGEIRGTDYRSESERSWYLANCLPPTPLPTAPQSVVVAATQVSAPVATQAPVATVAPGQVISAVVCRSSLETVSTASGSVLRVSKASTALSCSLILNTRYDRIQWWNGPSLDALGGCGCGTTTLSLVVPFKTLTHFISVTVTLDGLQTSKHLELQLVD
jgi:predicted Ser/Thr protein kinase